MLNGKDSDAYRYIPLDVLTKPTDGYMVLLNRWWFVEPSQGALVLRRSNTYQCNSSREVMDRLIGDRHIDIVFIEMAFVPVPNSSY